MQRLAGFEHGRRERRPVRRIGKMLGLQRERVGLPVKRAALPATLPFNPLDV
jgi:hypothetical protein